jgi:hypothetical protein
MTCALRFFAFYFLVRKRSKKRERQSHISLVAYNVCSIVFDTIVFIFHASVKESSYGKILYVNTGRSHTVSNRESKFVLASRDSPEDMSYSRDETLSRRFLVVYTLVNLTLLQTIVFSRSYKIASCSIFPAFYNYYFSNLTL